MTHLRRIFARCGPWVAMLGLLCLIPTRDCLAQRDILSRRAAAPAKAAPTSQKDPPGSTKARKPLHITFSFDKYKVSAYIPDDGNIGLNVNGKRAKVTYDAPPYPSKVIRPRADIVLGDLPFPRPEAVPMLRQ